MNEKDVIFDWNQSGPAISPAMRRVEFHDETLRDGIQSPSIFDPDIQKKKRVVDLLASTTPQKFPNRTPNRTKIHPIFGMLTFWHFDMIVHLVITAIWSLRILGLWCCGIVALRMVALWHSY